VSVSPPNYVIYYHNAYSVAWRAARDRKNDDFILRDDYTFLKFFFYNGKRRELKIPSTIVYAMHIILL